MKALIEPPMTATDQEIIRRVQGGDRGAYETLFDRHYATIYRFARWQCRDADLASDIASETFCRAYKAVDGFRADDTTSYLAYLLQIARRLLIRELRDGRRQKCWSLEDPAAQAMRLVDSCEMPLESALVEERNTVVERALRRLSPEDREIVLLAFERDLSRRDIAIVMGKPSITSVTSHLHRAMTKLRAIVQEFGYFDSYAPRKGQRH